MSIQAILQAEEPESIIRRSIRTCGLADKCKFRNTDKFKFGQTDDNTQKCEAWTIG